MTRSGKDLPVRRSLAVADLSWDGRVLRVVLRGASFGPREVPELNEHMAEFLVTAGGDLRHLVIDVRPVRFMSSMGLGFCIASRNEASRRGASAHMLGAATELLDLFRLMKLDTMFHFHRGEDELAKRLSA